MVELTRRVSSGRIHSEAAEAKLSGDASVYRRHLQEIEEELHYWPDDTRRRFNLLSLKKITLYRLGDMEAGNAVNNELRPLQNRLAAAGVFGPKGTRFNP
jgi:hypothetical protein